MLGTAFLQDGQKAEPLIPEYIFTTARLDRAQQAPANVTHSIASSDAYQQSLMFRIYCGYRVLLCGLLVSILLFTGSDPLVGRADPDLFGWICTSYGIAVLLVLLFAPRQRTPGAQTIFAHLFVDIGILTALIHLSGGSSSGLALLLLIDVAAAGLMLRGQLAALAAALATIALLTDTIYLSLNRSGDQNFLTTGMLGMLFFATAAGFHRLRHTQLLALERGADVSKLQNLNQLIVQRMRTGILVVDAQLRVVMMNQAATELMQASLLQRDVEQGKLPPLPDPLRNKLQFWQQQPGARQKPFTLSPTGTELIARFTTLTNHDADLEDTESAPVSTSTSTGDTLIFLEDNLQLAQRAQQLKLAALGRLTASISHEIRNPLGAISHAAQLLRESPDLSFTDQRLADIIQTHSQRMNSVIENVLQLSRRSPPNAQRIDLALWLADLVQQYRQGHPDECFVDIEIEQDIDVTVDTDQLGQVLTNLLDNALRYSQRATGIAHARLAGSIDHNNLPQLDIIDDGAGIPPDLQERAFEPFFTTESNGNGLGLYISRELCEANQARLHYLHNTEGKSCFRINFSHPNRKPLIHE